jgi:hypothetical protein
MSDVIPSRKWWVTQKKAYGVPDGAVKGIKIGELLDKYNNGKTMAERKTAAIALGKGAATYITKIDKKQVKQYAAFEKVFLDEIVEPAHAQVKRMELAADGKALYQSTLQKWFQAVQKLDPKKSKSDDLQRFAQYSRGVTSAGVRVKAVVGTKEIDKIMATIDELNDHTDYKNFTQDDAAVFIGVVKRVANGVRIAAKKQDLVDVKRA